MNELTTRIATLTPAAQGNTFEAVLSTNAPVRRQGYIERLGAWNQLPERIPLLDSHGHGSIDHILGFASNLRSENGTVRASITISETRPQIAAMIREGTIRSLSIGFTRDRVVESREGSDVIRTAEGINVQEASLVSIGADGGATFMDTPTRIRTLSETLGVLPAFTEPLITRNLDFEDARAELVREAARQQPRINAREPAIVTRQTSPADWSRALGEALACRYDAGHQPSELARLFVHDRVPRLCERFLQFHDISTTALSEPQIVRTAMTTSDFLITTSTFTSVIVQQAYRNAPAPVLDLCKRVTADNFKDIHFLRMSESPLLLKIPEDGEVKFANLSESEEKFKIARMGRGLKISFELMINDALGLVVDTMRSWAFSVRETEAGVVIALLTQGSGLGPVMSDGKRLYAPEHKNIMTAAVPAETSLNEGRVLMRRQTTRNGNPLGIAPAFVLGPPELETTLKKTTTSVAPQQTTNVNAFSDLQPLTDVHLTDTKRWYLFASPEISPVLQIAYLAGYEGPITESAIDFQTDNIMVKTMLSFGAGVSDWAGTSTNAGA